MVKVSLSQDLIMPFIHALEQPEFTLSLACLQIENDEALDASSTSIFADQQSAWGIWPDNMEADPPILLIFPSGITDIYNAVTDWLEARIKAGEYERYKNDQPFHHISH